MAEGKQGSSSGKGQSSGESKSSSAQQKTDEALKSERSGEQSGGNEEVQQPISEEQQQEQQQRSELNTGEDAELVRDPSGVMAPKGNAPGPERDREPQVSAVDTRPRIEPKDRATFLGAIHARDDQVQVPDEYNVFAGSDGERDAEVVELDAEPVEYFQVIATNQELVLRIGDQAFVLDREQTRGFLSDARAVASNVVS